MKIRNMKFSVLPFLLLVSVSSALDKPASFLRTAETYDEDRNLLLSWLPGFGRQCRKRLRTCEAATGGNDLPLEVWLEALGEKGSDGNVQMDEIRDIVAEIGAVDFSPLFSSEAQRKTDDPDIDSMRKGRTELKGLKLSADNIAETMEVVTKAASDISSAITVFGIELEVIVDAILFLVGLFTAASAGPLPLAIYLFQAIIDYLSGLSADIVSIAMSPRSNANTECMPELLPCNLNKLLSKVVPVMVGTSMLAASES